MLKLSFLRLNLISGSIKAKAEAKAKCQDKRQKRCPECHTECHTEPAEVPAEVQFDKLISAGSIHRIVTPAEVLAEGDKRTIE